MKKLCLMLVVALLASCQHRTDEKSLPVKNVLLDINTGQTIRLSEVADSVEVIFLEQTDDSDIARVERIIPYKGKYYMLNTILFSNGSLLVFDKQGNFVQKVDKKGGGPGEYVDLQDIAIDAKNNELVFMTQPKGIFRYDMDGNFIARVKGGYGQNIAVDAEGNCYKTNFCDEAYPYRLLVLNETDSIPYGKVGKKDFVRVNRFSFSNEFDSHDGKVFYSYPCCDSIFDVTKGEKHPYLYIDYNGLNKPIDKIFTENNDFDASRELDADYSRYLNTDIFRITDKFLYVGSVDGEGHGFVSLYSFKTGKTISAHRLIDDVFFPDNSFTFQPFRMPLAVEGDCLLWLVDPSWLLEGYENLKEQSTPKEWEAFCRCHPQMVEVCKKLNEESNPVLLKIKVKDF